jgi:hypothetical protein
MPPLLRLRIDRTAAAVLTGFLVSEVSEFSSYFGLDHGTGHVTSMSPEKNERLTSSKD